jgi:hypothetical protein
LSELVATLLGSFERTFEKAMVVGLSLPPDDGRARLRFVVDPKGLRLDPDERSSH